MEPDESEDYDPETGNSARSRRADSAEPASSQRLINTEAGDMVFDTDAGTLLSVEEATRAARIEAKRLGQDTPAPGGRQQHADSALPAHLRDDSLLPELNRRPLGGGPTPLEAATAHAIARRTEEYQRSIALPGTPEVIPNLPSARASAPVAAQVHAEMVRSDRIRELGIELYELAAGLDVRDPDHRGHLLPLEGLIAAWLAGPLSDHTRRVYRSDIRDFLLWCQTKLINPAVVGWADIAMYARHLETAIPDEAHASGERYAPATRVRHLTALKSFYTFCFDREEILRNPCARLTMPTIPEVKRRYAKASDQERLIATAAEYQWRNGGDARRLTMLAIITVQVDHGWRINEYTTTRLSDLTLVEPETGEEETTLPEGLAGGVLYPAVIRHMKRKKTMVQVLSDRAREAISTMLIQARGLTAFDWAAPRCGLGFDTAGGYLFTFKPNRPPHPDTLRVYLEELCRAAGVDPGSDMACRTDRVTFHGLRRASATRKRNLGVPLDEVSTDLGHSSIETTRKYYDLHRTDPTRSPTVILGDATPLKGPDKP